MFSSIPSSIIIFSKQKKSKQNRTSNSYTLLTFLHFSIELLLHFFYHLWHIFSLYGWYCYYLKFWYFISKFDFYNISNFYFIARFYTLPFTDILPPSAASFATVLLFIILETFKNLSNLIFFCTLQVPSSFRSLC